MTDAEASKKINNTRGNHRKRNIWLAIVATFFIVVGLAWLIYWLLIGRFYVFTEDAYIHGNQVMLSSQVPSAVKAIYADETNLVCEGQLVIELESDDYRIAVETAKKTLADTVRSVSALFQDAEARRAEVEMRISEKKQADIDARHRQRLVEPGAIAREQYETYQMRADVAEARVKFAESELAAALSLIEGTSIETHPRVLRASWNLRDAYLRLIRCQIWAPSTGYIAKRSAQVGDYVKEGDTLLFIIPLDEIWINANYKETQLRNVRIGQEVSYTADIYGREIKFHGRVEGFQPGSGDAFALLPPQNASGNWIKIIQRVPVRIKLDPEEIREHPLLIGLSMRVSIDVHDTDGAMLKEVPTQKLLFYTCIYEQQMQELKAFEPVIQEIIEKNVYHESQPSSS